MNHLDSVALTELRALVLRARYDFFIALHRNQGVGKTERGQQLLHRRARLDLPIFAVDYELHRPRA